MLLYLKHIFRSMRNSLLQPILIILTLTISTATLIISTKIATKMHFEYSNYRHVDNYVSDITIKLSSKSSERILFEDYAKKIVGDDGDVIGELPITGFMKLEDGSEYVDMIALDLKKFNEFYHIKYIEYGTFTDENLSSSIIISDAFANRNNLKIGDKVSLNVLNVNISFTVQAIVIDDGLLLNSEWACDISAVSDLIAKNNPIAGALSDAVKPYSVLRVKIYDKEKINYYKEKFLADERFADKILIVESENTGASDFFGFLTTMISFLAAAIIVLISSIVIATSIELMRIKRSRETALFMINGAKRSDLIKINIYEYLIYSAISGALAVAVSFPLFTYVEDIFKWNYGQNNLTLSDLLVGIIGAPLILIAVYLIGEWRAKKLSISDLMNPCETSDSKHNILPALIFTSLFAVSLLLIVFLPARLKIAFAICTIISLIMSVYFIFPFYISFISGIFYRMVNKLKKIPASILLSANNLGASHPTMNATRIITILIALVSSVIFCLSVLDSQLQISDTIADFDYVALNADDISKEIIENLDAAEDVYQLTLLKEILSSEGSTMLGISIDEEGYEYLNEKIRPQKLPKGNQVVLSSGLAKLIKADVGDEITLNYETDEYTLTVIEIVKMTPNFIYIDAMHFGLKNDLLCINMPYDTDSEEYGSLKTICESRGIVLNNQSDIFSPTTKIPKIYSKLLRYFVLISMLTAMLGITNSVLSAHIEMATDRKNLYSLGMTKNDIIKAQIINWILPLIVSIISMMPILTVILFSIDNVVNSFGIDTLLL